MQVVFTAVISFMVGSMLTWFWCGSVTSDTKDGISMVVQQQVQNTQYKTMQGGDPSDCAAFVKSNLPRGLNGKMHVHHWFTASRTSCKWNEDQRWSPGLNLPTTAISISGKPACNIWYVGAHVEGGDGIELQSKFGCSIEVFEPHPEYFLELSNNWKRKKIQRARLHNFGLGGETRTVHNIANAGVNTFVMEDGCEWEMMELLLSGGFAAKIKVIQWGSHWFDGVKDVEARYCKITEGLAKTHRAEFQQPFGWERWILTQNSPPAWQAPAETQCSHYFSLNPNRFSCCLP
eukprot:gene10703-661_t